MDTFKRILRGIGKGLKKIRIPLILLVIAFIVVTFVLYSKNKAADMLEMVTASDVETAEVEIRDILQTITATGKIESSATRTLSSTIVKDTKITAVNCEVGDYVEEGDILVTFSYEDINKTISQLKEDIVETEATQSITNSSNERQYFYSYGTETITMRDLQMTIDERKKALNEACDAYGEAKRNRDNIKSMMDSIPEYIENKVKDEDTGEEKSVTVKNQEWTALNTSYQSAENGVATALKNQEAAQLAYDKAVLALQDEIYKGSNTLAGATENYQKSTITANDSSKKLKRELENYEDKLDDYVITAPISGTVTSVKVEENNSFAGGDMVTIQDCSILYITTEIDEYDIPQIELGQKVMIKTDATRDDELEGIITEVAPVATASSNAASASSTSATYSVKVQILTSDERLKLGMTAKLSIILDEVKNTLSVPYNAIEEKEDGTMVIYALKDQKAPVDDYKPVLSIGNISKSDDGELKIGGEEDGKNIFEKIKDIFKTAYRKNDVEKEKDKSEDRREIPVTIGMESDYYTQISGDGVTEGLIVAIPEVENDMMFDFSMFGGPR